MSRLGYFRDANRFTWDGSSHPSSWNHLLPKH